MTRLRTKAAGCGALATLLLLAVVGSALATEHLRLATTTSTENSGLLAALLPAFEKRFGVEVDVIAVGSGKALKIAENGDVDVVLSHAPALEEAFVDAGHGVNRRAVMFNDFVIVGPPDDPAHISGSEGASDAFRRIAAVAALFVSRGDESGTHQKEKALWTAAGIAPAGSWYLSAGLGMGEVLLMASERRAYTLADRGTFLAYKSRSGLAIVCENDPPLFNPYTIIAVNPARHAGVKYIETMQLIAWLTSPQGQEQIAAFTVRGQVLFRPSAIPVNAAR